MAHIDARDVLDPDAKTQTGFRGRIVGHFRQVGSNAWDDFKFVSLDEGLIEVFPGIKVQIERFGARIRMRHQGRVIRVAWDPRDNGVGDLAPDDLSAVRQWFIDHCLEVFDEAPGRGLAQVVADKLRSR